MHRLYVGYARSPNHPMKLRFLGWIRRLFNLETVIAKTSAGLMRLNTNDYLQARIFMEGAYEAETLKLAESLLKVGDCFLDVGANVGQYALAAAGRVGKKGQVVAVEPNPEICADLLYNRQLNGLERDVQVVAIAANDSNRLLRFAIPSSTNRGLSQELDIQSGLTATSYWVSGVRLCEILEALLINRVHVVKIDVEGSELRVLKGLLDSAFPMPDHILFEFAPKHFSYGGEPKDVLKYLEKRQYQILTISGKSYEYGDDIPELNLWARLKSN